MITLYTKTGCPYCLKVINKLQELKIPYTEKNVSIDEKAREELLEIGGNHQAPFLTDSKNNNSMYESDDIINYLNKMSGAKTQATPASGETPKVCTLE